MRRETDRGRRPAHTGGGHTNYLDASDSIKSWLLTRDHKRIGLLYMASVTAFFLIGGLYALSIRLELLTPRGDLMQSQTYNKLFTHHGIIMVFFFLIPSIPAVTWEAYEFAPAEESVVVGKFEPGGSPALRGKAGETVK